MLTPFAALRCVACIVRTLFRHSRHIPCPTASILCVRFRFPLSPSPPSGPHPHIPASPSKLAQWKAPKGPQWSSAKPANAEKRGMGAPAKRMGIMGWMAEAAQSPSAEEGGPGGLCVLSSIAAWRLAAAPKTPHLLHDVSRALHLFAITSESCKAVGW